MRLLRLCIENWGCHESLELEMIGSLQIEGRNGTGKSTILDAIRFIFSSSARGYVSRIRNGSRSATVRLDMEADGQEMSVEKTIFLDKASKAFMTCAGVQVADNASSVHNRLSDLVSEDILDRLVYIPQGGLTSVLDKLGTKDGKREMDRLFGIERLERVWESAGGDIKAAEGGVKALLEQIGRHPDDAPESYERQITMIESTVKDLNSKASQLKAQKEVKSEKMDDARKKLTALRKRKDIVDDIKEKISRADISIEGNGRELKQLGPRIDELLGIEDEIVAMERQVLCIDDIRTMRDAYSELVLIENDIKRLEGLGQKKEEFKGLYAETKALEILKAEHSKIVKSFENITVSLAKTMAELSQKTQHYKGLSGLEGMAKCPRCGQRLSAFNVEKEITETAQDIAILDQNRVIIDADKEHLSKEIDGLKEAIKRGEKAAIQRDILKKEIDEMEAKNEVLVKARSKIMRTLKELDRYELSKEQVEKEYERLKVLMAKLTDAKKRVLTKKELVEKRSILQKKLDDAKGQKEQHQKELEDQRFDRSELENAEILVDDASKAYHESHAMLKDIMTKIELEGKNLEGTRQKLKDHSDLSARIAECKRSLSLLRQARELFHRDKGLARYLRESYVEGLNELLTRYFKRFNENPRYLDIVFAKDYDITFKTSAGTLKMNQISGGERVQLALAFRLALLDLMSPIRMLILDEPFGSLDEDHRELLGDALNMVAREGQLIVVTHVPVQSMQLEGRLDLGGY